MKHHKIKVTVSKTVCINFTKQQTIARITKPLRDNEAEKAAPKLKYLGIKLDRRLTKHQHVEFPIRNKHVESLIRNGNATFKTTYPLLGG